MTNHRLTNAALALALGAVTGLAQASDWSRVRPSDLSFLGSACSLGAAAALTPEGWAAFRAAASICAGQTALNTSGIDCFGIAISAGTVVGECAAVAAQLPVSYYRASYCIVRGIQGWDACKTEWGLD